MLFGKPLEVGQAFGATDLSLKCCGELPGQVQVLALGETSSDTDDSGGDPRFTAWDSRA